MPKIKSSYQFPPNYTNITYVPDENDQKYLLIQASTSLAF